MTLSGIAPNHIKPVLVEKAHQQADEGNGVCLR